MSDMRRREFITLLGGPNVLCTAYTAHPEL